MIIIQLIIYNKLRIKSNNITNVVRDLIPFYKIYHLIKSLLILDRKSVV